MPPRCSTPTDPAREQAFFDLFKPYFDLEKQTARAHDTRHYSLDRMRPLAELAGNPERSLRILHIAGTKGKGSTAWFLDALLRAAGRTSGVFTSPHLLTVRERFQTHGRLVAYETLQAAAAALAAKLPTLPEPKPTLFEIMTVLGLALIRDAGGEFAVLETGIGGLLDSTNYVPHPEACVITAVSFDHMQLLGNDIREIAAQKAGILKPGVPVVLGPQPYPEAEAVIRETAARLGCAVLEPVPEAALAAWPQIRELPDFLQENFRTALRVPELLTRPGAAPFSAPDPARFEMPALPGRFQILQESPPVVLDAAHNADSARRLAAALQTRFPGVRFTTVLGVVEGKDVEGIFTALRPVTATFVLTHPRNPGKGSELARLEQLAAAAAAPYRVAGELRRRTDFPVGEPLLFTGSFFTALIGAEGFVPAQPP